MKPKHLGMRIREARKEIKMTQEALAEKAEIGVGFLGEIERGEKHPSIDVFIRIVEALGVPSDYILRDVLSTGKVHVFNDITRKLDKLTPRQVNAVSELIDVYIKNL